MDLLLPRSTAMLALCIAHGISGQAPIPPPVGTDLDGGVPVGWTIETPFTNGWTWQNDAGVGGSGGLIMDCGSSTTPQETTLWTPWLDLTAVTTTAMHFDCAIIGGSMGVPPPIWLRGDAGTGPVYIQNYGFAGLIPPPTEVILSTIDPNPPLDLAGVQWVSIDFPIGGGPLADSVRFGIAAVVPLDGYALLDNVYIDGPSTAVNTLQQDALTCVRLGDRLQVSYPDGIVAIDLIDAAGRVIRQAAPHGATSASLFIGDPAPSLYSVRILHGASASVVRVAW